ncbi:MAG TPA: glycoside hydrolase family 15 protein [Streptosporangiaceae bacterium]
MGQQRLIVRVRRAAATLAATLTLLLGPLTGWSPAASAAPRGSLPTLEQAFNNVGITSAGNATAGNFDGIGESFSDTGLAADALSPGEPLLHDGLAISWPDVAPGQPDNVIADGQTIALTGSGSTLGVIGASAFGSTGGTFTVNYSDGSSSTASVTLADWIDLSPAAGTDVLATTGGWNPGGTIPVSLFYTAIPLATGKSVVSVTLPQVGQGVGKNTPSLHVFNLTIGFISQEASGAPGVASHYDLARKDCVGTAADRRSKVWYTVADGELSDTYAPTIDNTDVKSLDPIVTGPGFTALQPRDLTYTVAPLDGTGMACQVTAHDAAHDFNIVTDFITDPSARAVVMRFTLVRLPGAAAGLHLYLRLNPLLNGHGGGGTDNAGSESATVVPTAGGQVPLSYSTNSFTEAVNRSYAKPIYAALSASAPFAAVETGFAGTASDGLTELDGSGALTSSAPNASDGNVVQTVELAGGSATVALGFGSSEHRALRSSFAASSAPFGATYAAYQAGWRSYDAGLRPPQSFGHVSAAQARAYYLSANVIKASEDKTFAGATAASLASPWGQAVPAGQTASDGLAPYFGSYREVFPRDAYETFTGFLVDGDLATARDMVRYWFDDLQLPNGSFPRNGLMNGAAAPDTGGLQLDETADPILAAWQAGLSGDASLYADHIKPAADFLVANGPADGVERWEEQSGFSPSTMADEVAGLVAAAAIARVQGDPASQRLFLATADNFRRLILATTITDNGPLSSSPYFIRVDKTGSPDQAFSYSLGNGNPTSEDQRSVVDQGFLELVRLGELPASDPVIANSLVVAGTTIDSATPSGTGVLRYNGDGYGDCEKAVFNDCSADGEPWATSNQGTGHPWPVLSGENGEYQILARQAGPAASDLGFMLASASGVGLVPEQIWNYPDVPASPYGSDPSTASIGFTDGLPDGSAAPLTWAQAQLLRLIADLASGHLAEQPSIVADRYLGGGSGGSGGTGSGGGTGSAAPIPLSVTAPLTVSGGDVPMNLTRPSVTVDAASVPVSGTTVPGATVDIAQTGTAPGDATPTTSITTVTADSSGAFSTNLSLQPGSNSVEVASTAPVGPHTRGTSGAPGPSGAPGSSQARKAAPGDGVTNEAIFTVTDLHVPGTVVLNAAAAAGGGTGPGTYAYPTATNSDGSPTFAPDSFRLTGLTVINSGSTVTFQVGIANLQSTFGSLLGAQLINLYIHAPTSSIPAGEVQSTAAAGAFNYSIASADAWNQLIEVDGFGTDDWVTPSGSTSGLANSSSVGTPQVSIAQLSPSGGETPGLVTITVPTSALGTPGSGWTFTLTLTGQDGFGINDARTFAATPQSFNFGVCSTAVASEPSPPPICSFNPAQVPFVLDTIPPTSVNVQTELDPTQNPGGVTLQGVTVP